MMTLASVIDPMRAANRLADQALFDWKLCSVDGQPVTLAGQIEFPVQEKFDPKSTGDVFIVIASFGYELAMTALTLRTIDDGARRHTQLFGIEAGTWLLARAGVTGMNAVTTHWEDTERLQQAYPHLDVRPDRFVCDRKIWTAGGASPAFDMMLDLITKLESETLALEVASVFSYDRVHQATDPQPRTSLGLIEKRDPSLASAIRLMERHSEEHATIAQIANELDMSVRRLEGLFSRHLNTSPAAYWRRHRLLEARKMVLDTALSMQDIAIRCGFNSQSAFSRAFRMRFEISPLQMRTANQNLLGTAAAVHP